MARLPGIAALALLVAIVGAALLGLVAAADRGGSAVPWPYLRGVLAFTLVQAALSTLVSLLLGGALALALARRRFPGRALFIAVLNLATVLPAIVAVFGIVAAYGRSGWFGSAGEAIGLPVGRHLYGLSGILIAHVFFNAPLAARVFLAALAATPGEHWRLAAHLGMRPGAVFRLIDWPILRREAPGIAGLIFLLCATSFAVVLALGGGPGAATLEVAIYEAVQFEADFGRAALLAFLQVGLSVVLIGPLLLFAARPAEAGSFGTVLPRPDAAHPATRAADTAVLAVAALLVVPPVAATVVAGVLRLETLADAAVLRATLTSFAIALPAGALAVLLALAIAAASRSLRQTGHHHGATLFGASGTLVLAVPPIALSAGLFVALRPLADPFALALPLIVTVNALMALPFALRQVEPPLAVSAERYGRLADSLGIAGTARLRIVDWPLLGGPLRTGFVVAVALSLGDLGVAAFFGSGTILTLPLLLSQRLGAYRTDDAASLALLLAVLVLGLLALAGRPPGAILARDR